MRRIAMAVALAGATLTTPATAGAAESAFSAAADGRPLFVGSVVTQGVREGDVCRFAEGATGVVMTLSGAGAGEISVQADDSCALVVTHVSVGPPPVTLSVERPGHRRPKVEREPAATSRGSAVDGVVAALPEATAAPKTRLLVVTVRQRVYRETGMWEYDDWSFVDLVQSRRTGALLLGDAEGYCYSSSLDTLVYETTGREHPWEATMLGCHYEKRVNRPDHVYYVTGGDYLRMGPGGVVLDERELSEHFHAWNVGPDVQPDWVHHCDHGGPLPVRWYSTCKASLEEQQP